MSGRNGSVRRKVGRAHPARRMERVFGYGALAGLGLLLLSIPIGIVTNLVTGELESPVFLVPLGLGTVLACVGWVMWGSWSATLDRYTEPLSTTAKLTLAGTTAIILSVLLLFGAGIPVVMYGDTEPPPGWVIPTVVGIGGAGVLLFTATLVGSAVYGGIALGGPRWWWVGVLLSVGIAATSVGWAVGQAPTTVLGVVCLVGSVVGYRRALKSGLRQGRPDAVEADGHRRGRGR
ncbi:hypothetical protein GCM10007079_42220 [Nocardiopsis terrae]|uniref:Uncharacterized protein n=1 Tax=Nocardiopsis terrae TaxID=372655 RepID=A0ABR9HLS7_9ACTN|nr:hypothetical protein [Nocardiopsis terrae]MBE1459963.1 hypothetical protein [Nocardiopsis terrae]GHC93132.1 hypothetical protein GCM10007079_42220 [Nocardiopsis terrae]